ncbi:hypothetical protein QUF72_05755 [Desulfobacterales bacterium HSG2]|nr:hypothetical protein [Desulfobacterales bacterium HSG2]
MLVEDDRFWEVIIENVKPDLKDKTDFPNPSSKGTRGKDILKKFKSFVKENFIICIDSDCEYLYDDNVWYVADYIYHTIVYRTDCVSQADDFAPEKEVLSPKNDCFLSPEIQYNSQVRQHTQYKPKAPG